MIPIGARAPLFSLPAQDDKPFQLQEWIGKHNVLLLFIPLAFTPICSTELPALASLREQFWYDTDTVVAVITGDAAPSNREWARRCRASEVFVLADHYPLGEVSQAYGAWIQSEGIPDRASVIIDKQGFVRYAESVGKFGKRSVPTLLQLAAAVNGSPIPVPETAQMPLDLPVLFVMSSCPHCANTLNRVRAWRCDDKIVVREVSGDRTAYEQLLSIEPQGNVPTLYWRGRTFIGEAQIEPQLQQINASSSAA